MPKLKTAPLAIGLLFLVMLAAVPAWSGEKPNQPAAEQVSTYEGPPPLDAFVRADLVPVPLKEAAPVYPGQEQADGVGGIVWMKVLVAKTGSVLGAVVHKSSGSEPLDRAALEAAVKNVYKPAVQNGQPVAMWISYKVTFEPSDEDF